MSRLNEIINFAAKQVNFGQLNFSVDVHNGQVRAVMGDEHSEKHFPGDGYQQALDMLHTIMAEERNSERTGVITFTFDNRAGQTKKLFVHRQFKQMLTE